MTYYPYFTRIYFKFYLSLEKKSRTQRLEFVTQVIKELNTERINIDDIRKKALQASLKIMYAQISAAMKIGCNIRALAQSLDPDVHAVWMKAILDAKKI